MTSANRPSVRFRRIGSALRHAREAAGFTIETAARKFGRSPGWISTTENGLQPIRVDDLADLLDFYGVADGPLRESLLHLAAQGRRKNWQRAYEDRISPAAADLASLEDDSAFIRSFQPCLVPGLMQIEDYARTVIETGLPSSTRNNAELVAFRMARQECLKRQQPPTYCAIIAEAVLHEVVGEPAVMRRQLKRLIEMAQLEHVALHVLPYPASAYLWVGGPFHLVALRPPGRLTVAVIEYFNKSSFIDDEREVKEYEEVFTHLLAAALDQEDSLDLINRLASRT